MITHVTRAITALTSQSAASKQDAAVRAADLMQPRNILVPLDGSATSFEALRSTLASAAPGSAVYALQIVPELQSDAEHIRQALIPASREERAVAAAERECVARGIAGAEVIACTGSRREAIARAAAELSCDMVVVPRKPQSRLARFFARPSDEAVARHVACPVLVV